jgi:GH15 family glucan-1,4-alpha-glucosidase
MMVSEARRELSACARSGSWKLSREYVSPSERGS